MRKALKVLILIPSLLMVVSGIRWLVDPSGAADALGMTLLDGVGRSSQIGDGAGYFLTLGFCMLMALISEERSWFYPPIMLLMLTVVGRLLAWLLHDAALTVDFIAVEVIMALLLLVGARVLTKGEGR